jgi:hypothetical protein
MAGAAHQIELGLTLLEAEAAAAERSIREDWALATAYANVDSSPGKREVRCID